jgi:cytochrome c-type biogenesis protein CcmE
MNAKAIVAGVIIFIFLIFGAWSFLESNVEYTDFQSAYESGRTVQVEGTWVEDRGAEYNTTLNEFTFYMTDSKGKEMRVVLEGPRPNNFEIATSVVARGRFVSEDEFRSTNVLTKCPSKYEGSAEEMMSASDKNYYE